MEVPSFHLKHAICSPHCQVLLFTRAIPGFVVQCGARRYCAQRHPVSIQSRRLNKPPLDALIGHDHKTLTNQRIADLLRGYNV